MNRRSFVKIAVKSASVLALSSFGINYFLKYKKRFFYFWFNSEKTYAGKIVGASFKFGHLLRDLKFTTPSQIIHEEIVIIGGGISGLSAGWWIKKKSNKNFTLLELEDEVGGNSLSGKNQITRYPWGAHYVSLISQSASYCHELFEELGVIEGYDESRRPIYNETYLCADPQERLLYQGRWQEGILPQTNLSSEDQRQYHEFFQCIEKYKITYGEDGKLIFSIPLELSSKDPKFLKLDLISMKEFMFQSNWNSIPLHWYINYCCRDDFGTPYDQVSAWAGLHYFASRIGVAANADSQSILTWPEGNGWLVEQLKNKIESNIKTNTLVYSVKNVNDLVEIDYFDTKKQKTFRIISKKVIFSSPRFVAARVIQDQEFLKNDVSKKLKYFPWMVANITLKSMPYSNKGAPLSWDNVNYNSPSLGYILATHQNLTTHQDKTVVTYYLPLTSESPELERKKALSQDHQQWAQKIAKDLIQMHPEIENEIENIDVWIWGHGMISPYPGFIWGKDRFEMLKPIGNIYFAHTDMSGISIFEEAQYRGVEAAKAVLF